MDTFGTHESEERLELYALGRLPDSEIVRLEEHLLVCDRCRDELEEVAGFGLNARASLKHLPLTPFFPGWFSADWFGRLTPQLGLAGASAAIVLAASLYFGIQRTSNGIPLAPVASLQLTAKRGLDVQTVGPARELDLFFTDIPALSRIEIVQGNGESVWSGPLSESAGRVKAKIERRLPPGLYYARVTQANQLPREFEFKVVR